MKTFFRRISLAILALTAVSGLCAQETQPKIAPEIWRAAQSGREVECIIHFTAKADLQELAGIHGKTQKAMAVFQRLNRIAAVSQASVKSILDGESRPYRSFFIVNAIYARADRKLLMRLANRPEIAYIQANPWVALLDWRPEPSASAVGRSPVEWGLDLIRVPEVWSQGIDGTGVVVGGQDTGVEWTHPAIKEKYRAWTGNGSPIDHNYHWFDAISGISPIHGEDMPLPENNPCGLSVDFPCDDHNHGTYTMGISVGDDGQGNQIGVAPGSRWIACRNMERGYGSPATYLAGFEWFLAPTDLVGNNPRPELAPHVINNSWGCPELEGCNIENWGVLETAIENLRAAGVVVVVSAGNEGPACGSVDDPSAIFAGAFAVGATNAADTLADFSSRGPVVVDGSNRVKPDVVAPGVGIRSARRDDKFMVASGTSAAGPFVVGVVALMIQANPLLSGEVELIEKILRETTVPAYDTIYCSGFSSQDIPNPMTGYGRIDALAAVQKALQVSSVEEQSNPFSVRVYPNPSRGTVFFVPENEISDARLEIFDATGRKVEDVPVRGEPVFIDLLSRPSGVYWWRWIWKGQVAGGKIMKH